MNGGGLICSGRGTVVERPAPLGTPSSQTVEQQSKRRQYLITAHWEMLVVGLTGQYILKDFKFLRFRAPWRLCP